jgi:hypothetical protein
MRFDIYANHGYFEPHEAEALKKDSGRKPTPYAQAILRRFNDYQLSPTPLIGVLTKDLNMDVLISQSAGSARAMVLCCVCKEALKQPAPYYFYYSSPKVSEFFTLFQSRTCLIFSSN